VASQEMELAPGPSMGWVLLAACQGLDTERFYATSYVAVARAKGVCSSCFVQTDCLSVADELERGLGRKMVHGIWGGLTPDERIERRVALAPGQPLKPAARADRKVDSGAAVSHSS